MALQGNWLFGAVHFWRGLGISCRLDIESLNVGKSYFCDYGQHHRDARKHGFNEIGDPEEGTMQLCDECYRKHLARVDETAAKDSADYRKDRAIRHAQ